MLLAGSQPGSGKWWQGRHNTGKGAWHAAAKAKGAKTPSKGKGKTPQHMFSQ